MKLEEKVKELQTKAKEFLSNYYLVVNGVEIYPKEIEVYYLDVEEFNDVYVHNHPNQKNRPNRFYVHRKGRGGLDYVVSESDEECYSYLLRSVVIDEQLIVGPVNTYDAILAKTGLTKEDLEEVEVNTKKTGKNPYIFTSPRVGLDPNKKGGKEFKNLELRLLLCDEYYKPREDKGHHYKNREKALTDFMIGEMGAKRMTKEKAIEEAKEYLGYTPKALKEYPDATSKQQ